MSIYPPEEWAVSSVLVKEAEGKHLPIYYVSKILLDAETRYPEVERLVLALMVTVRRLRPYFSAYKVVVLTNQPLKQILERAGVSGRLVKWSVELTEFEIEYAPRPAIKAQVLADFLVEGVHP